MKTVKGTVIPKGFVSHTLEFEDDGLGLTHVSTAELHAELLRREGVTFHVLSPEAVAEMTIRSGARRNYTEVSGPATIIVNVD